MSQARVLLRARGLASLREAVVSLATGGEPLSARRRLVVVPSRAAGELLRQSLEAKTLDVPGSAVILPDFVTRDEWVARLHEALPQAPPLATRIEREVLLARAAERAGLRRLAGGVPFDLRPGLVAAMLDFYDHLKRRQRTVRRFARALFDELRVERGTDRGTESLLQQTCFLALAFLGYERLRDHGDVMDEHSLRRRLLGEQPVLGFDHLVVAVADHPSDPRGLWPVDFDLAGRLRHLSRIDVVMTDEAHDAGFRERLERELPGIYEERAPDVLRDPVLVVPDRADGPPVFVSRDREEELREIGRLLVARAADATNGAPTAIVFQRPLPYLFAAEQVLGEAGIPYQAFDALPLAAEPSAAVADLVIEFARTRGSRDAAVAMLRCRTLSFAHAGEPVSDAEVAMLDRVLRERRARGECAEFDDEISRFLRHADRARNVDEGAARRAAAGVVGADAELELFRSGRSASVQMRTLGAFLRTHERPVAPGPALADREYRARSGVAAVLESLAQAFERHDDRPRELEVLVSAIHHAIEARTFTPRRGTSGVHLVDAVAARFGAFDHVYIVGLVDTDWPERARRTIFYPSPLLKALGWPQEPEHLRAEQAAFRDLLRTAAVDTRLSAFQLEGDAIVGLSPMTSLATGHRTRSAAPADRSRPLFLDEMVATGVRPAGLQDHERAWHRLRRERPPLTESIYSGRIDAQAPRAYRVSQIDRYVDCPFKYFAEAVLRIPDERDEPAGLSPLERGNLLHAIFERFYRSWQAEVGGSITTEKLPDALARFAAIARDALADLPAPDRLLEETRLLGSIVARGVAERVFDLETASPATVVDRWLESDLSGTYTFPMGFATKVVGIRGKADRIDVLADGSIRVLDYKLSRQPDKKSSIQIAVYAHCASAILERHDGRPHPVSDAMYLAFGDDRYLEGRLDKPGQTAPAVAARVVEFAGHIDRIESGEFPPNPRRPSECQWCHYATVCRKEYVAEDDETADAF